MALDDIFVVSLDFVIGDLLQSGVSNHSKAMLPPMVMVDLFQVLILSAPAPYNDETEKFNTITTPTQLIYHYTTTGTSRTISRTMSRTTSRTFLSSTVRTSSGTTSRMTSTTISRTNSRTTSRITSRKKSGTILGTISRTTLRTTTTLINND